MSDNKNVIQYSVHHYTFTVPEMPWKKASQDAVEKREVKKGSKCKHQGACKIWKTDETSCGDCAGYSAADWWENETKDY